MKKVFHCDACGYATWIDTTPDMTTCICAKCKREQEIHKKYLPIENVRVERHKYLSDGEFFMLYSPKYFNPNQGVL